MVLHVSRRVFDKAVAASAVGLLAGSWTYAEESREVPWLAEIQQPPAAKLPDDAPKLVPLLIDAAGQPITTREAWQPKRDALKTEWSRLLGSLGLDGSQTPKLTVIREDRVDEVVRQLVRYEIEPGIFTEAYLLRPAQLSKPAPGVVVFHSTVNHSILQPAGLGPDPEKAFGLQLAKRGFVTISPRNFLWPDNHHIAASEETSRFHRRHPRASGMAKMLFDSIVAVNLLVAQPNVDAQRIGAVGHSLGAKEVLYLAAFDERVQVTVSSEGGIGTKFSNWDAAWYLGAQIRDAAFAREHHELLGMMAPRAFLLIGGESADGDRGWPFIDAAIPVYRLFTNSPRIGQFNHRTGHAVTPECERRMLQWFEAYL